MCSKSMHLNEIWEIEIIFFFLYGFSQVFSSHHPMFSLIFFLSPSWCLYHSGSHPLSSHAFSFPFLVHGTESGTSPFPPLSLSPLVQASGASLIIWNKISYLQWASTSVPIVCWWYIDLLWGLWRLDEYGHYKEARLEFDEQIFCVKVKRNRVSTSSSAVLRRAYYGSWSSPYLSCMGVAILS